MERDYYGLPVSILAEDRDVVLRDAGIVKNDPPMDVGGRDLTVKFLYDSPYWEAIVYQHGEPKAVVYCVLNQGGLMEGLRRDDPAVIQRVFDIQVAACRATTKLHWQGLRRLATSPNRSVSMIACIIELNRFDYVQHAVHVHGPAHGL